MQFYREFQAREWYDRFHEDHFGCCIDSVKQGRGPVLRVTKFSGHGSTGL